MLVVQGHHESTPRPPRASAWDRAMVLAVELVPVPITTGTLPAAVFTANVMISARSSAVTVGAFSRGPQDHEEFRRRPRFTSSGKRPKLSKSTALFKRVSPLQYLFHQTSPPPPVVVRIENARPEGRAVTRGTTLIGHGRIHVPLGPDHGQHTGMYSGNRPFFRGGPFHSGSPAFSPFSPGGDASQPLNAPLCRRTTGKEHTGSSPFQIYLEILCKAPLFVNRKIIE